MKNLLLAHGGNICFALCFSGFVSALATFGLSALTGANFIMPATFVLWGTLFTIMILSYAHNNYHAKHAKSAYSNNSVSPTMRAGK